jgi:hypothetical protein
MEYKENDIVPENTPAWFFHTAHREVIKRVMDRELSKEDGLKKLHQFYAKECEKIISAIKSNANHDADFLDAIQDMMEFSGDTYAILAQILSSLENKRKYPKNMDDKEKKIIDKLVDGGLILRDLLPDGKYALSLKWLCKKIVRILILEHYNANSGFIFMSNYISHGIDPSSIKNYFREVKKDIPLDV